MLPVLIVGAGPVGLTLAADLGRRGIACLVVEENPDVKQQPRAMGITPLTIEHFRRWGLEKNIYDVSLPREIAGDIVHVTRVYGHELARVQSPSIAEAVSRSPEVVAREPLLEHTPYCRTWCAQHKLEPMLRDYAMSLKPVEIRFAWRMESFTQDEEGITATIAAVDGNSRETVRASYLVGCDGGRSLVRHALDIKLTGRGVLGHVWGTWFRAPTLWEERPIRPGVMYWNYAPGCASVVYSINARDEWWMNTYFRADEDFETIDPVERLRAAVGRDIPVEVLSSRAYKAFQLVAERYADRRVLMAGDAVHLFVPPGGNGMNTGIQDAFNLGWKLSAVLAGWGGKNMLASYEIERRPIAVTNTNSSANAYLAARKLFMMDPRIDLPGAEGEQAREKWGAEIRATLQEKYSFKKQFDLPYVDSPICVAEVQHGTEDDSDKPVLPVGPGSRAPHVWLADGRSALDLADPERFVLLRFDAGCDVDPLIAAAAQRGVPLAVKDVADMAAARAYRKKLVMVRPDGMIAWCGESLPADVFAIIDTVRGAR
jgi:2-polyprenyl-6-methoxyphenol hydroxylase-like FAD-dependent oxidoreductase